MQKAGVRGQESGVRTRGKIRLLTGDCRERLRRFPAGSFTACVTDPPYHLTQASRNGSPRQNDPATPHGRTRLGSAGFMGLTWDGGGVAFEAATWRKVLRVLKPGGWLLAFGGARTWHRLACAIEDAGFEIRDPVMWLYGQGFPKSLDVSKAMDKAAGAKRRILSEGRSIKRMIPGADQNATGSWIKDNGRVFIPTETAAASAAAKLWEGWGTALKPAWEPIIVARKPVDGSVVDNCLTHGCGALNIDGGRIKSGDKRITSKGVSGFGSGYRRGEWGYRSDGRWPANLIHDGSPEVVGLFPQQSSGGTPSRRFADKTRNVLGKFNGNECPGGIGPSDGSAARFFYCAKASRRERGQGNSHPTVKPLALMRYLLTLVTQPEVNRILDPFCGSGTTLLACRQLGLPAVGIDSDPTSIRIANRRLLTPDP